MSLLDFPIIRLQFPEHLPEKECLLIDMDITGDIYMQVPDDPERSQTALRAFALFWQGDDRTRFIALVHELFEKLVSPVEILAQWHRFQKRFKDEFKAVLSRSTGNLKEFIRNPFGYVKQLNPSHDLIVLEVVTRFTSSQPLIRTQIDLDADMNQVVSPQAAAREDLMYCHACGVDFAISIKKVMEAFLLKVMKTALIAL
jgi:hypothetical protein